MERRLGKVVRALGWLVAVTGAMGAITSALLFARIEAPTILLFTALSIASAGYGLQVARRREAPERPIQRLASIASV